MKHDERCELGRPGNPETCHCAERAFLSDCSPEEAEAFLNRTGYDHNNYA